MFEGILAKLKALFSREQTPKPIPESEPAPPKSYIIKGPDDRYRGEVKEGVYYTRRSNMKGKQHYMFKYGGYGASVDTLTQLHDGGVKLVHLLEHKDGSVDRELWSALSDWFEEGAPYTNKQGDNQRILPMRYQFEKRSEAEKRISVV